MMVLKDGTVSEYCQVTARHEQYIGTYTGTECTARHRYENTVVNNKVTVGMVYPSWRPPS